MNNYPDVAFLVMSHKPIDAMRAIIGVNQQIYPGKKIIYMLRQHPFPVEMTRYPEVELRQLDVEGEWPLLWYKKLMAFFKFCAEDYFVWWDEDDRFENKYVEKALEPVLNGSCALAWNHSMVLVRGSSVNTGTYRSPIGTMAGRVDIARAVAEKINPAGNNAKDCQYKNRLDKTLTIGRHKGWRYYIHHKDSHTTTYTNKGRPRGEDVDA